MVDMDGFMKLSMQCTDLAGQVPTAGRAGRRALRLALLLPLLLLAACEGNPLESWAYQRTQEGAPPEPAPRPNVPSARITQPNSPPTVPAD
jgi:hypothetical protein